MFNKVCYYCLFVFTLLSFTACQKEVDRVEMDYEILGVAAHDLLSSSVYTSLLVEISYMPGYEPSATSLNALETFLNTYLNKPAGIYISKRPVTASGKSSLTLNEIVQIEKTNRSVFTGGNIIAVHFLITDGNYNSTNIFATSYWNTSSSIFGKAIYDNSGGPGQVSRIQLMTTILEHEFGHLLGLVGQGSPMQTDHKDVANGAHCNNSTCLMYYGIETAASGMSAIPLPDANCLKDLKANGGK